MGLQDPHERLGRQIASRIQKLQQRQQHGEGRWIGRSGGEQKRSQGGGAFGQRQLRQQHGAKPAAEQLTPRCDARRGGSDADSPSVRRRRLIKKTLEQVARFDAEGKAELERLRIDTHIQRRRGERRRTHLQEQVRHERGRAVGLFTAVG